MLLGSSVIACLCIAFLGYVNAEPTWQGLRVTWGVNLLSSRVFAKLPLTESKARSEGFSRLAGGCTEKFLGHRYMKGLDTTAVLLYDVNGYIAGIQYGIPRNDVVTVNTSFNYDQSPAFQHDKIFGEEEIYFLTAYFVDPSTICSGGRTREQYLQDGTGTGLYFQNGTNPIRDSVEVPLYEKDMADTHWVKGGCVRSMGVHYWYNMHENMSCSDMFPFTAIYNRGKLTNFAFISPGHFEFSRRFEHPPASTISMFLPTPVPRCVYREFETAGGFSSMHVYFTIRPWNMLC